MASRKMLAYFSILNIKLHICLVILSLSPSHRHLTQGNKLMQPHLLLENLNKYLPSTVLESSKPNICYLEIFLVPMILKMSK